jgi:predicted urease superfamily metal-dependent hydrolase
VNSPKAGQCSVIGLHPQEIQWVRLLVTMLRHPDPLPAELARQALEYVHQVAESGVEAVSKRPAARG